MNRLFGWNAKREIKSVPSANAQQNTQPAAYNLITNDLQHRRETRLRFIGDAQTDSDHTTQQPKSTQFDEKAARLWKEFTDSADSSIISSGHLVNFLCHFNPNFLDWNEEMQQNVPKSNTNIEKLLSIPYVTTSDGAKIFQLFSAKVQAFTEALRSSKSIERFNVVEVVYLVCLLSRAQDNVRALQAKNMIPLLLAMLKVSLLHVKNLFYVDIKHTDVTSTCPTQSPVQVTLQILFSYSFQFLANCMSYQGVWTPWGTKSIDEQESLQYKIEMSRHDFLGINESTLLPYLND